MCKTPWGHAVLGQFCVTGACAARLDKVGTDCYAARITGEARRRKRHRSEMMRALDRLLRFISIAIIPYSSSCLQSSISFFTQGWSTP